MIWIRRPGLPKAKEDRRMRDLFYMGLTNAAVVAVLAVPAYGISHWGKRPALAHLLWLFILIKLVTPPLWEVPFHLPSSAKAKATENAEVTAAAPVVCSDSRQRRGQSVTA